MLYLGIFLFILILLLVFPVNTAFELHLNEKALEYNLKVYLFKFIRVYKKSGEIDDYIKKIKDIFKKGNLTEELEKGKEEPRKKLRPAIFTVLNRVNIAVSTYCSNKERFTKLRLYTSRKFILKNVDIKIKEGTGDAAETGIYYGVVWSILGSFSAFLSNFLTILFKNVNVACDYNNKTLKAEINCIFSLTIANIIIVFIRLYYLVKKYKQNTNKVLTGGGNNE